MSSEIPFRTDVPTYRTIVNGVWSDIQNAWIASFDYSSDSTSEVRVNLRNQSEVANTFGEKFKSAEDTLDLLLLEIKLMNARLEAALDTTINHEDIRSCK